MQMCSKWWQILVFLMHKEEDLFKTAAPLLPHNYQCPKTTVYGNCSRRARRAAISGKAQKKSKLWRVSTRVAQKVMPHIFFLGNYLIRMYETHAQYNWMFPLYVLFFHIISI